MHLAGSENTGIPQLEIKIPEIPQEEWFNTAIPQTQMSPSQSDQLGDKFIAEVAVFLMLECSLIFLQQSLFPAFGFATGCDVNEKEIEFNGCETACKGKWINSFLFG